MNQRVINFVADELITATIRTMRNWFRGIFIKSYIGNLLLQLIGLYK